MGGAAPVAAGGLVFVADRTGVVQAFNDTGKPVWKAYTSGAVYYPPAVAHDRVFVGSADGRVYAYEAATGRFLWSYRVAPQERRIPVFGKLISRWPVAGGVVVEGDTVYAAAGITHYDGTYVVALDALTGKLKAENSTSGVISAARRTACIGLNWRPKSRASDTRGGPGLPSSHRFSAARLWSGRLAPNAEAIRSGVGRSAAKAERGFQPLGFFNQVVTKQFGPTQVDVLFGRADRCSDPQ